MGFSTKTIADRRHDMSKGFIMNRALAQHEADKKSPGDIVWTFFRCADIHCNKLFTVEDREVGFCGGCQGVRYMVARYVTEDEQALIDVGKLHPHKTNLDEIGPEPPVREVR
jgi:hypothetical protein